MNHQNTDPSQRRRQEVVTKLGNPMPYRVGEQFAREIWPDVERQMVDLWKKVQRELVAPEIRPDPISFEKPVDATWVYSRLIDHAAAGGLAEVRVTFSSGYDTHLHWNQRDTTLWPTCTMNYVPSQFEGEVGDIYVDGVAFVEVRQPERVSKRFTGLRKRFRTRLCRFTQPDSPVRFPSYSWQLFRRSPPPRAG